MSYIDKIRISAFGLLICGLVTLSAAYAEPAPPFTLPTDSGDVQLSDLHGKVVYLDFWATWCAPCRKSFPWFNEIMSRYKDRGLVIVAVNMDKDRADVEKFLKKYPANFTIAYDPEGDVATKYNVIGMPSSYLIGRDGEIALSHVGFREKDKSPLESAIKSLFKE